MEPRQATRETRDTMRKKLDLAPSDVRERFAAAGWPAWLDAAGWSLAGLRGKAARYRGRYWHTLRKRVATFEASGDVTVAFGYDVERRGVKRPYGLREEKCIGWLD